MGVPTGPVLVVEDDPAIRQLLCDAFETEGFDVATALDGEEAIRSARERRPAAVILDIGLPRVDGAGVADAIREAHGDSVPVFVVTASNRIQEASARIRALAYITKPFDVTDLVRQVRAAIEPSPGPATEGSPATAS